MVGRQMERSGEMLLRWGGGRVAWQTRILLILTFSGASIFWGIFFACIFLVATSSAVSLYQIVESPLLLLPVVTVTFAVQVAGNEYWLKKVFRFFRQREEGRPGPAEEIPGVIESALAFPLRGSLLGFGLWVFAATLFPLLGTKFIQLTYLQAAVIGTTVFCTGMATFLLNYYMFKIILTRVLERTGELTEADGQRLRRFPVSIRLKLVISFLMLLLVGLSLLVLLISTYTIRQLKGQAAWFGRARLGELEKDWRRNFPPETFPAGPSETEIQDWLKRKSSSVGSELSYLNDRSQKVWGRETPGEDFSRLWLALHPEERERRSSVFRVIQKIDFLNFLNRLKEKFELREEGVIHDYGVGDLLLFHPLTEGQVLLLRYPFRTFTGEMQKIFEFVLAIFLLGFFLSLGISRLAAEEIASPFQKILRASTRISAGDLRERIALPPGDEIGELAQNFQRMTGGLRQIVQEIEAASREVEQGLAGMIRTGERVGSELEKQAREIEAMREVARAVFATLQELARTVTQFAALAQESSASIAEMDSSVREVFHSLGEMSQGVDQVMVNLRGIEHLLGESRGSAVHLFSTFEAVQTSEKHFAGIGAEILNQTQESARQAQEFFEQGWKAREQVRAAVQGAEKIRDSAAHEFETYHQLGESIEKIAGVVALIDGVAERTSLLGLNASIIAVGSLEHSRNFSVVAEEIKELAERVGNSTQEVGELVRFLRQTSENSRRSALKVREKAVEEIDSLQAALELLAEVDRKGKEVQEAAGEIGKIVGEEGADPALIRIQLNPLARRLAEVRKAWDTIGVEGILGHARQMEEVVRELKKIAEGQAENSRMITQGVEEIGQMVKYFQNIVGEETQKAERMVKLVEEIQESTAGTRREAERITGSGKNLSGLIKALGMEISHFRWD